MKDTERVKNTVQAYIDGVVNFDFSLAESAWHPEGLKISYDKDERTLSKFTIIQTRPNLSLEKIELMKQKVFQSGSIESVEVTGDAAIVKLVWQNERDGEIWINTDYILLKQLGTDWKIVAKVYNQELT